MIVLASATSRAPVDVAGVDPRSAISVRGQPVAGSVSYSAARIVAPASVAAVLTCTHQWVNVIGARTRYGYMSPFAALFVVLLPYSALLFEPPLFHGLDRYWPGGIASEYGSTLVAAST